MSKHETDAPPEKRINARKSERGFELFEKGNASAWVASDLTVPLDDAV